MIRKFLHLMLLSGLFAFGLSARAEAVGETIPCNQIPTKFASVQAGTSKTFYFSDTCTLTTSPPINPGTTIYLTGTGSPRPQITFASGVMGFRAKAGNQLQSAGGQFHASNFSTAGGKYSVLAEGNAKVWLNNLEMYSPEENGLRVNSSPVNQQEVYLSIAGTVAVYDALGSCIHSTGYPMWSVTGTVNVLRCKRYGWVINGEGSIYNMVGTSTGTGAFYFRPGSDVSVAYASALYNKGFGFLFGRNSSYGHSKSHVAKLEAYGTEHAPVEFENGNNYICGDGVLIQSDDTRFPSIGQAGHTAFLQNNARAGLVVMGGGTITGAIVTDNRRGIVHQNSPAWNLTNVNSFDNWEGNKLEDGDPYVPSGIPPLP